MPLLLGVNIDHVATLRQARYARMPEAFNAEPSPLEAAIDAMDGGADSLTIHVRGDRRHMQEADAFRIRAEVPLPLNFEMGVTGEMMEMALRLRPAFACLVPETREEVTTEGGLDVAVGGGVVAKSVARLRDAGIRVSLFIDPELRQVAAAATHTTGMWRETYASASTSQTSCRSVVTRAHADVPSPPCAHTAARAYLCQGSLKQPHKQQRHLQHTRTPAHLNPPSALRPARFDGRRRIAAAPAPASPPNRRISALAMKEAGRR